MFVARFSQRKAKGNPKTVQARLFSPHSILGLQIRAPRARTHSTLPAGHRYFIITSPQTRALSPIHFVPVPFTQRKTLKVPGPHIPAESQATGSHTAVIKKPPSFISISGFWASLLREQGKVQLCK